ncbi:hypothetical protein ACFX16_043168 [Malus domestica]
MSGDTQLTQGAFSSIHADGANIGQQEIFFPEGSSSHQFLNRIEGTLWRYLHLTRYLWMQDADLKIQSLSEGLESKDWVKVCESLNNVRHFAIHHSALLAPTLENVVVVLVKAMKNPRSALIKTLIMASSDVFIAFGDGLLDSAASNAFDQLLLQLLLKASQDKRFVCEEADRALSSMVQSLTPLPLLQKLRAYASHGNPRVRAKAAIAIASCVAKMGLEGMNDYGLVSLVKMAADLLNSAA